jgi:hemerythrin superfamily protein
MEDEMATRTQTRTSSRSRSEGRTNEGRSGERSAFSWGDNAGPIIGAALAGAALGFAANFGRKALTQGMAASYGDWDEMLAHDHDKVLELFDRMLATDQTQTFKRSMLLMRLKASLDKHAHEEEMVVYPALREANMDHDAEALNSDHLQVKTFLYELEEMGHDSSNWLDKVRAFRGVVAKHAHMEEEEIFPRFKQALSEEQNARVTSLVNKDGFWMA